MKISAAMIQLLIFTRKKGVMRKIIGLGIDSPFFCGARGYDENLEETLGLQTDMLRYYDGQSGLPLFALAAANDDGTTEGM